MTSLPWTLLGLPDDFTLAHLALALDVRSEFPLDHGEVALDPTGRANPVANPAIFGEPGETDRFGHVPLSTAILHPLLLVRAPDWLAQRAGVSSEHLRQLVDHQRWAVIKAASDSGVEVGSLVDEFGREDLEGDAVELATGAEAIERLLAIRGHALAVALTRVRVLPIGFRPSLHDLDDLYRRLIIRAVRLRRLLELDAPEIILRSEIIMTQAAGESLFCNEARESPTLGVNDRVMQSLLGLAGPELAASLIELDARVGREGVAVLTSPLPTSLLRTVRVIQALHLELRPEAAT